MLLALRRCGRLVFVIKISNTKCTRPVEIRRVARLCAEWSQIETRLGGIQDVRLGRK